METIICQIERALTNIGPKNSFPAVDTLLTRRKMISNIDWITPLYGKILMVVCCLNLKLPVHFLTTTGVDTLKLL